MFAPRPFEEIPDADWLRVLRDQRAERRPACAPLPAGMRARNWGRIVFVSSESALQIPVEMIHYGMTKTAQLAIARGLAETSAEPASRSTACFRARPHPKVWRRS